MSTAATPGPDDEPNARAAGTDDEIRPITILAVGGSFTLILVALMDPALRTHCARLARDPHLRRRLASTIGLVTRESGPYLEGRE